MRAEGNKFDKHVSNLILKKMNIHARIQNNERVTEEERAFSETSVSMSELLKNLKDDGEDDDNE